MTGRGGGGGGGGGASGTRGRQQQMRSPFGTSGGNLQGSVYIKTFTRAVYPAFHLALGVVGRAQVSQVQKAAINS